MPGISQSVNLWNSSHPDIHVNLDETTSGVAGTYAKMYSALQAGNAPDLGQIEYATLPNFEHVGGLVDLSQYGAGSIKQDFVPLDLGPGQPGRRRLRDPTGHRSDGAVLPRRPVQEVRACRAHDLGGVPERRRRRCTPPTRTSTSPRSRPTTPQWFSGLAWQAGARWFGTSGDTWFTGIDDPASQQVASFWQQLISDHLVKIDVDFTAAWYKDLSDGTLLTWPTAVWGENTLVTNAASTKGDWRVAPMPNWGATPSNGNWGGSTTVVFKDSKHPAQAAQFAEWLNTNQRSITGLITQGGLYPADLAGEQQPAANSPVAFYGGQNIWQVFEAGGKLVNTSFQWGPIMSTTFTQMQDGFGKATSGSGTLTQVLASTQSQTIASMKQQGFSVKPG